MVNQYLIRKQQQQQQQQKDKKETWRFYGAFSSKKQTKDNYTPN